VLFQFNSRSADYGLHQMTVEMLSVEVEIVPSEQVARLTAVEGVEELGVFNSVCELDHLLEIRSVS
jgi:hypothetical protein